MEKIGRLFRLSKNLMDWIVNAKFMLKDKQLLGFGDTVDSLVSKRMSFARFGDGELGLLNSAEFKIGFQDADKGLNARLNEILFSEPNDKLLIGLPHYLFRIEANDSIQSTKFWISQSANLKSMIKKIAGSNTKIFGDTQFSRLYMDKSDKQKSSFDFETIKRLWFGKNVLVVEGKYTMFGVNNDLLSNALSVKRILIPEKNAYKSYNRIFSAILEFVAQQQDDVLVLLAGGPTATVLAYDLSTNDVQAIDIGHLDIEYEWFLRGAKSKIAIPGKYVNETSDGDKNLQSYNGPDVFVEIKN